MSVKKSRKSLSHLGYTKIRAGKNILVCSKLGERNAGLGKLATTVRDRGLYALIGAATVQPKSDIVRYAKETTIGLFLDQPGRQILLQVAGQQSRASSGWTTLLAIWLRIG